MLHEPFVLIVDPSRERRTVERLADHGFTAYSPSIWKRQRAARGRVVELRRAMFPCYAFVDMAGHYDWRSVEKVEGVWRFLKINGEPAFLHPDKLAAIMAKESDLEQRFINSQRATVTTGLAVGQTVQAKIGPWADMLGKIERFDEKGRAVVLFELLGAPRETTVERAELVAA
jgi:transcriptional antiterminator RfaH